MNFTYADRAYQQIKEKIINLEMSPGSFIREAELMAELGLGRTPIREALKQLQASDLVVVAPRRGLQVADISITDLQQIYEVRLELEPLCARLAAQRTSPVQLARMKQCLAEYQTTRTTDKKQLIDLDRCFHQLAAEAAGNKFLRNQIELFYNLSLRIWYLALQHIEPEDLDLEAHLTILAAFEVQASRRAEQAMRQHIQHFHNTIKLYL